MEKESPGLSFSNAVSIWSRQWADKWRHKAQPKLGHPMILLMMIVLLWSFLNHQNKEPPIRIPHLKIDSNLKVELSCNGQTKIKGVLLSSSEVICVLLAEVDFDCKDHGILIDPAQMKQLPLNKWNLFKTTRFVEKIPAGAESCKSIKKIYYESW